MNNTKWRPENWTYGDGYSKPQRKCLHGKGRVRAFEAGADAMLEALRKGGYETSQGDGLRLLFGTDVFIPDDPQPSEKPVIMPGHNENSQPLMICPKAKECPHPKTYCGHQPPHEKNSFCFTSSAPDDCPHACVHYVPEKWVDVTYEHLREKLGKYKYGLR